MSWRVRMSTVSSSIKLKEYPIKYFWNNTSKIQLHLTNSLPNSSNIKRIRSKENLSSIIIKKKRKITNESPSFILVCGQNICGQLGLSTQIIERHKPQYLKIVDQYNLDENIQYVCAGALHSCALTVKGDVYTWGCNDDGALGRITNDIDDEYIPKLVLLDEKIQSICAGDSFTVAFAESGRVYITGCFRSSDGILGLFEYKQIVQQGIVIPINQPIKQIACGADFCLLLTENGDLYSFGNNETGQLGRDSHLNSEQAYSIWLQPSLIPFFQGQHILNIWAGGHGFFVLTKDSTTNHLYTGGANSYGQLGHSLKQPLHVPIEIILDFSLVNSIIKISCALHHTLILDSMGNVYGLGRSDDGRLGDQLTNDVIIPKKIHNLIDIIDIAAGGSVSFAIDKYKQISSFGMGDTCQTGHGNQDIFSPTIVKSKQLEQRIIQQISVGAQHTLFLVKNQ